MNYIKSNTARVAHFTSRELAERWRISDATLRNWRWYGSGPAFFKAGSRVVYRLEDILSFESAMLRPQTMGVGK